MFQLQSFCLIPIENFYSLVTVFSLRCYFHHRLAFYIFLLCDWCMHMCVYGVCICVCDWCMHMCVCMEAKGWSGCHPHSFSALFLSQGLSLSLGITCLSRLALSFQGAAALELTLQAPASRSSRLHSASLTALSLCHLLALWTFKTADSCRLIVWASSGRVCFRGCCFETCARSCCFLYVTSPLPQNLS